jgi:hypothetical protein
MGIKWLRPLVNIIGRNRNEEESRESSIGEEGKETIRG